MAKEDAVVHVVDDDDAVRVSLVRLINAAGLPALGYATADRFLEAAEYSVGCVVLDIRMPGRSGLDVQALLGNLELRLPVIFLTGHGTMALCVQAMQMGALDFLTKPVDASVLLSAIRRALQIEADYRSQFEKLCELRSRYATLTRREREVYSLVVTGRLNKQVAGDLNITERTVKAHRSNVMDKMGARSLADLIRMYDELARPPPWSRSGAAAEMLLSA